MDGFLRTWIRTLVFLRALGLCSVFRIGFSDMVFSGFGITTVFRILDHSYILGWVCSFSVSLFVNQYFKEFLRLMFRFSEDRARISILLRCFLIQRCAQQRPVSKHFANESRTMVGKLTRCYNITLTDNSRWGLFGGNLLSSVEAWIWGS